MSNPTPEQMEEAVEAAQLAKALSLYARRFGKPEDDPHVALNAKANKHALWRPEDSAALAAAYPIIRRAVLEEVIQVAKGCGWAAFSEAETAACEALQGDIVESLEALAGEAP